MREILFKAKRKDNGEWVFGYLVENMIYSNELHLEKVDGRACAVRTSYEIIPETICQYTGLDDKNGVKIFEKENI